MTLDQLTTFLGISSLLNVGLILIITFILMVFQGFAKGVHAYMFNVDKGSLPLVYVYFLSFYKILILFFNLVPYVVLKIMGY